MELLIGFFAALGSILGGVLCLAAFVGIFWAQSIGLQASSRKINEFWITSKNWLSENTAFGRALKN